MMARATTEVKCHKTSISNAARYHRGEEGDTDTIDWTESIGNGDNGQVCGRG